MAQHKLCENCPQAHECQEVYRHLGNVKGPSIAVKVIVAFLLPIIIFIIALAVFEWILKDIVAAKDLRTIVDLLLALTLTFGYVLIVKIIGKFSILKKAKTTKQ